MTKRFLFTALILFVIFDLILFFYFINKQKRIKLIDQPQQQKTLSYQKQFKSGDPTYQLGPGQTQDFPGAPEYSVPNRLMVLGYIKDTPYINKNNGNVEVSVIFQSVSKKDILATLVLGENNNDEVQTFIAKGGKVGYTIAWQMMKISQIGSLLIKNDPVLINTYVQYPPDEFIKNDKCDSKCKKKMDFIRLFTENNILLLKVLQDQASIDSTKKIGPPDSLILYGN